MRTIPTRKYIGAQSAIAARIEYRGSNGVPDEPGGVEIIDPHCVPVTPADELRIYQLPGGRVLYTLMKRQISVHGEMELVVVARIEMSKGDAKVATLESLGALEGGPLATMRPANILQA